jgi:hypothetical protein
LSAKRHANADLARALADRITHHAVNSHCRKHQRYTGEYGQQHHVETARRKRAGKNLVHRADV